MVRCQVLGTVSVRGSPVSAARQRRLLAVLVMGRSAVVSSARLVDVVWASAPPPSPLNALQTYISRLRATLGADAIVHRPPGYALALAVDEVDAWRFEALVDRARHLPAGDALEVLDEALNLWRGPAYAEFADEEFARGEAVRLEELRSSAAATRLDALLRLGRADEVLAESLRLIEADPYRESAWEQRMRALHASGRTRDAVQAYHEYRTRLVGDVGLEPSPDLAALERALVAGPPTEEPTLDLLPVPLTSLIGRDHARHEVAMLLTTRRVVTLVGPAGVGKTRLAVEVAHVHPWPALFIELAAYGPDDVGPVVARALGCADGGDLLATLRRRLDAVPVLLVLDNCEHVVEAAAALVDGLMPFCPQLRVMSTSRVPLESAGEVAWNVPPLDPGAAAELFRERAGLRDDKREAIAAICAAVDRLPLGIELAAAAARRLPLDRIADALDPAPDLPETTASGRHRSLDAAIAWSFQLVDQYAQELLRRLAVFEGGWTVEAAEMVAAGDGLDASMIPPVLSRLVAASLVTFDPSGQRYAMLDTIHAFAQARLAASGRSDHAKDRHLLWSIDVAAVDGTRLVGPEAAVHAQRLEAEYPNLRTALRWALDSDRPAEASALACGLVEWWAVTDAGVEAIAYLRRVLAQPGPATVERVELTVALSGLLSTVGDLNGYSTEAAAAVAMARELQDPRALCRSLVNGSFTGRRDWAEEALAVAVELDDARLVAEALHMLGLLSHLAGNDGEAIGCYERSIATGSASVIYGSRHMLASACRNLGQWQAARHQLMVSERELSELVGRPTLACVDLALVELSAGDREAARRAMDRAVLWGRPGDDYVGDRLLFDAVAALVQAEEGNVAAAATVTTRIADTSGEATGHGVACLAWLVAGEVVTRAGDREAARRCFEKVLAHQFGTIPYNRAHALAGLAGTLQGDEAWPPGAEAASLRARYGFVTPRWFTAGRFAE